MGLVLHCADIGSVARGNFGWARLAADDPGESCSTGNDISLFADNIAADLDAGHRVAVGFECPLFVPVPNEPKKLTSARPGENDRAWSAGAGAGSLATGLTETVWILDRIRQRVRVPHAAHTRWQPFQAGGLFLWEAFVTKEAKADTHPGDAELAVLSFRDSLPDPDAQNAIVPAGRVRSLIGAAVLQAGWASELAWLATPCIVIRVRPRAPDVAPGAAPDRGRI